MHSHPCKNANRCIISTACLLLCLRTVCRRCPVSVSWVKHELHWLLFGRDLFSFSVWENTLIKPQGESKIPPPLFFFWYSGFKRERLTVLQSRSRRIGGFLRPSRREAVRSRGLIQCGERVSCEMGLPHPMGPLKLSYHILHM